MAESTREIMSAHLADGKGTAGEAERETLKDDGGGWSNPVLVEEQDKKRAKTRQLVQEAANADDEGIHCLVDRVFVIERKGADARFEIVGDVKLPLLGWLP